MAYHRYIRHYGVDLFDDLHNYFPALIYEPDAFAEFADVLFYVRRQMQREMDLFSAGQRTYVSVDRTEFPSRRLASAATRWGNRTVGATAPANPITSPLATLFPRTTFQGLAYIDEPVTPNTLDTVTGLAGLTGLMNMLVPPAQQLPPLQPLEPVIVRPTQAQIAAGSSIERVDAEEDVCAICQENMAPGSEARCLTACDHRFHVACIDNWFQRSVRCPVCRHDIREAAQDQ